MAKGDIRLSPKHGVNPAIPLCFFCNKEKNELILAGKLPNDDEAPRRAVWDLVPCDECKSWMVKGVICISVRDNEPQTDNPYRTGGWVVLRDAAVKRFPTAPDLIELFLNRRFVFLEDSVWKHFGLPDLTPGTPKESE